MKVLFKYMKLFAIYLFNILFVLIFCPILFYNYIDFNIQFKKNNFYISFLTRVIYKYSFAYTISTFIYDFPVYSKIYKLIPELKGNVLQVGCGNGLYNLYIKKYCKRHISSITNLDINYNLLKNGQKKGLFKEIIHASVYSIPESNIKYDYILFARCFHHIKYHRKALKECGKVLKTGGKIIIFDPVHDTKREMKSFMMNSLFDGLIWVFNKYSFSKYIESVLPEGMFLESYTCTKQVHFSNYNLHFSLSDGLIIIKNGNE